MTDLVAQDQLTEQRVIDVLGVKGTREQVSQFVEYARRTGLDPFAGQINLIQGRPAASIDGLRVVASRTGEYEGQAPTQWCGADAVWVDVWLADEPPHAARVGVYRAGFREPLVVVSLFREAAKQTKPWQQMPALMLAKVAEAQALRKAFPAELSGLYSTDEGVGQQHAAPAPAVVQEPTPSLDDLVARIDKADTVADARAVFQDAQVAQLLDTDVDDQGVTLRTLINDIGQALAAQA